MTLEQWVVLHVMITEHPEFHEVLVMPYLLLDKNDKARGHVITRKDSWCKAHCFEKAMKRGIVLQKMPDWAQVLWDKVQEMS